MLRGVTVRASSQLLVWQGTPRGFFPTGDNVFPVRWDVLAELVAAVSGDLQETHLVAPSERDADEPRPLALVRLRMFFQTHAGTLSAVLARPDVQVRSRALGVQRVARLQELDAPPLFLASETEALARIDDEPWAPVVDPFANVADVLGAASMVDLPSRRKRARPLTISIDIADVVLLGLHCALEPEVESLPDGFLDAIAWTPFEREAAEGAFPSGTIRVRPAIYAAGVDELAYADVRADPRLSARFPGGGLLRVRLPAEDDG